jgi:hypothetical protein
VLSPPGDNVSFCLLVATILLPSGRNDVGGGLRAGGELPEAGIMCGGLRKEAMQELRENKKRREYWFQMIVAVFVTIVALESEHQIL